MALTLATSQLQWCSPGALDGEGEQMMVAAVDAMHEGDDVGGAIGQTQSEIAVVERNRTIDVARKDQDVRQPAQPHARRLPTQRGRSAPSGEDVQVARVLCAGDDLGRP